MKSVTSIITTILLLLATRADAPNRAAINPRDVFVIAYGRTHIPCARLRGVIRGVYPKGSLYGLLGERIQRLKVRRRRATASLRRKLNRRIAALRKKDRACLSFAGPVPTPAPHEFIPACSGEGAEWKAPIGVPRPPFGIDQSAEQTYGTGFYTHYVDSSSAYATDERNPHGSPEKPRLTIPAELSAGSVVLIHGGPYPASGDRVWIVGHGTPDRPIFIRGVDPANPPRFDKKIMPQGEYMIFEDLLLNNCGFDIRPYLEGIRVHHIAVRRTELRGKGKFRDGGNMAVVGLPDREVNDIVIYRNLIHDNGDYFAADENDVSGVAVGAHVKRLWVLNNHSYRNGGDSVTLAHGAGFSTDHIYIGCNHFHDDRENAVDIKEANDVIVSQNSLHGYRQVSSSSGEALVIHYEPRRIWVLYNEVFDSSIGLITTGSDDTYFIGNRIFDIHHFSSAHDADSVYTLGTAVHARNAGKVSAINNTIYNVDNGISSAVNTRFNIVNNIVSNIAGPKNSFILFADTHTPARSTIARNLLYQPGSDPFALWPGSLWGDPLFIDPAAANFRLPPSSPAVNAGGETGYQDVFRGLYGLDIARDYDNGSRTQGGQTDMGAHER